MSVLEKLTEGIVERSLQREGAALLDKWEATGLLEGLDGDAGRQGMARLLENQASQLLKEASSMAGGDVEGFASVAFPIVRRVFGGLLANDLVSVQPMSLPSGLIFFMDFTYTDTRTNARADQSIYGGGVVGSQLTGGVDLSQEARDGDAVYNGDNADKSFYNLNNGYASPTGSLIIANAAILVAAASTATSGYDNITADLATETNINALTEAQKKQLRFDPDLLAAEGTDKVSQVTVTVSDAVWNAINHNNPVALNLTPSGSDGASFGQQGNEDARVVRRLTKTHIATDGTKKILFTFHGDNVFDSSADVAAIDATLHYPLADNFTAGGALGSVVGSAHWGLEGAGDGRWAARRRGRSARARRTPGQRRGSASAATSSRA